MLTSYGAICGGFVVENKEGLYTTKRIRGGTAFQCQSCEYRITTLDFDSKYGNCRTQAATAMNQHAAAVHHQPMLFSSSNQQRN